MATTNYYQFDRTASNFNFTSTTTIPTDGYDLSEFNNDSRGTPRVADWTDFSSFSQSQFDALIDVFGISSSQSVGYFSWDGDPNRSSGNKYYRDLISNRAYYLGVSYTTDLTGGWHATNTISTTPIYKLHVGSWQGERPIIVYFPDYQPNGGHDSLSVNSTTTSWDSTNNRFSSADNTVTLSHNGSTWVINDNDVTSTGTINSQDVPSYVDPTSTDIVWQNSSTVTTTSNGGASGDPHITTFGGDRYTL